MAQLKQKKTKSGESERRTKPDRILAASRTEVVLHDFMAKVADDPLPQADKSR
jgi:hypothetical protein